MAKNDGGPAFPNRGDNMPGHEIYDGMSLRDWFAGMAMQGFISASYIRDDPQGYAAGAYGIADAMLAERDKS